MFVCQDTSSYLILVNPLCMPGYMSYLVKAPRWDWKIFNARTIFVSLETWEKIIYMTFFHHFLKYLKIFWYIRWFLSNNTIKLTLWNYFIISWNDHFQCLKYFRVWKDDLFVNIGKILFSSKFSTTKRLTSRVFSSLTYVLFGISESSL